MICLPEVDEKNLRLTLFSFYPHSLQTRWSATERDLKKKRRKKERKKKEEETTELCIIRSHICMHAHTVTALQTVVVLDSS